jgi:hypothetical protein
VDVIAETQQLTARVTLYKAGHGPGLRRLSDPGWRWYDVVAETGGAGYCERTANGRWLTQWIEDVGVVCAAIVTPQDTLLADWLIGSGTWEESYLDPGYPRVKHLRQLDAGESSTWSLTTAWDLPDDPSFALRVWLQDTVPEQNNGTGTGGAYTDRPSAWVKFGADQGADPWWLELRETGAVRVWGPVTTDAGTVVTKELGSVTVERFRDGDALILVRVVDGELLISGDGGWRYERYDVPGDTVHTSPLTVSGAGCLAAVGLWQVAYEAGHYWSPDRETFKSRDPATIDPYGWKPTGTDLVNVPYAAAAAHVRHQTQLVPTSSTPAGAPWATHRSPCLQAVRVEHPAVWEDGGEEVDLDLEGRVRVLELQEPEEPGGVTLDLDVLIPDGTAPSGSLRWRRAKAQVVEPDGEGGETVRVEMLGHLRTWRAEPGGTVSHWALQLALVGDAQRAKVGLLTTCPPPRTMGDPAHDISVNEAIEWALDTIGVAADKRQLDAAGDTPLEWGAAKAPRWWQQPGEEPWELLVELARSAGCRLDVRADGTWETTPWPPSDTDPTPWVAGEEPAEPGEVIGDVTLTLDSEDTLTSVWGYGEEGGKAIARFVTSGDAQDPASLWYAPWEVPHLITQGDTTGTELSAQVVAAWEERRPRLATLEAPAGLRWDLARHDRYTLPAAALPPGIPSNAILRLTALRTRAGDRVESGIVATLRWEGDLAEVEE